MSEVLSNIMIIYLITLIVSIVYYLYKSDEVNFRINFELKNRGLALRAIKELVPRISRTAPGSTDSKVKLLEDEQPEREKLLEFQKILEHLITQELHMKKEGEDQCRDLDEAIRNRQLARKEAAVTLEKKNRGNKKKGKRHL